MSRKYEDYTKSYQKTPKGKYLRQKVNAKNRGLKWEFTFETWWKVWQDSGKWEQRGRGAGQYCMCRIRDEGSYNPENVQVKLMEENSRENNENIKHRRIRENSEWEPTPWEKRVSAWDIY